VSLHTWEASLTKEILSKRGQIICGDGHIVASSLKFRNGTTTKFRLNSPNDNILACNKVLTYLFQKTNIRE
jgi:hypothetical protein